MSLLAMFIDSLEDISAAGIMADYIFDHKYHLPEATTYINKLQDTKNLSLITLIDSVSKFGEKQERHLVNKIVRKSRKYFGRKISYLLKIKHNTKSPFLQLFIDYIKTSGYVGQNQSITKAET